MAAGKIVEYYLVSYNTIQACGWALALYGIVVELSFSKSWRGVYSVVGSLISFLQFFALLEVVHAALGITSSKLMPSLLQWGGRTHWLFAILRQIPEVQEFPSVSITFAAWSLSEVIRYPHHVMSCVGISPSWITNLRYTAFILLYPIGAGPGEMWLMYEALPYVKKKNFYAGVFNNLHFSYHSFIMVLLIFYPAIWLNLYLHMFKQRRSKLKKSHNKKKEH